MSNNRTIVITGASSGIGESLATIYAKQGNVNLVLASRTTSKLTELANQLTKLSTTTKCLVVKYDASNEKDCQKLIENVIKEFSRIDILLLCAGVSYHNQFKDTKDLNVYRQMMDINYFGYMYTTFYALPHLIEQYNFEKKKAQIAVVSSISGELGLPLRAGYCASKFAVNGFFESLRMEVPQVDITMLNPTSVETPMRNHGLGTAEERQAIQFNESKRMSLQDCCAVMIHSIESRKKKVVFPFSNYMASLLKPFFPSLIEKILLKKAGGGNHHQSSAESTQSSPSPTQPPKIKSKL
ncbi:hypothetical protein DFA_01031 [Cavenderia fasciculata]|uniref:Short-chain dehydrogenase/reductase family protein n=1 Tax=Cavenderia fasciculata TaxID=261658 RepID=F4PV40_CACFS|nr:uncharacterized protein DFA_01031 [Cavenderia fasciculata]EGG21156.1 hypothetical protein DFA_01031 [Cavenderia fasciculata]|eukprot:XP_004359006.1 hypothetical protein DFA_01031 [Cavenderia fasciculata]